jgi:uncharacterized protein
MKCRDFDPLSSPSNPISEPAISDLSALKGSQIPVPEPPVENPPWSGWDVLALAVLTIVTMVLCILAAAYALRPYLGRHTSWTAALLRPEVIVGGQLLAYLVILFLMYKLVRSHTEVPVLEAVRWNWPQNWTTYVFAGFALEVCLLPFAYLLPMPKNLPVDEFFKTARDAYVLSVFGILFAPLFEEMFFRGFLYPVLARRLGMPVSIVLTALAFAAIHGSQLKYSWGPVLVIFLVGVALTTVRAIKKSVAATVLMHMAYNGTIFVVAYFATDGFRHMEKFNQ